jgi:histidinol-phosphatase
MQTFDLDRIGGRRALRDLVSEVLAAGDLAKSLFARGAASRTEKKPDRSPVTEADREVEARLRRFIEQRFPHCGFYGEESGTSDAGPMRFLVDPIDGTRAFIRGQPTWSVLVALESEGEPVAGIAYMPASEDLFVGTIGDGATWNGRPCRVSEVASLDDASVSHGGLGQFTEAGITHVLPKLGERIYTCRGFADFEGYKRVLLGQCDGMIDPSVKPYDIASASVLVREAGGRFTSFDGTETVYGGSGLASNGHVHDALVSLLATS